MTVFLTILKIIGWIILILFALFLLSVLSVLFVPVHYKVKGKTNDRVWVRGKVSWLLGIVGISFSYEDENLKTRFRILFFSKKVRTQKENRQKSSLEEEPVQRETFEPEENPETQNPTQNEAQNITQNETENETENEIQNETQWKSKWKCGFQSVKQAFQKLKRRVQSILSGFREFRQIITDEKNKKAMSHLKKETFHLLKKICPKKFSLIMKFSAGEPDQTGILMGILACFPIGYQNRWQVTPDFEADHFYSETDFVIKGSIRGCHFFASGVRLFFDKNVRRLFQKISGFGS